MRGDTAQYPERKKEKTRTASSLSRRPPSTRWKVERFFAWLDAAIALYMRCARYTPQEVANELYRHTPARPHEQSRDERIDYGAE